MEQVNNQEQVSITIKYDEIPDGRAATEECASAFDTFGFFANNGMVKIEEGDMNHYLVKKCFLSGMGPLAVDTRIVALHKNSCSSLIARARLDSFKIFANAVEISDFGLSKLLKPDQTRAYTIFRATRGYTAPEWHSNNSPITVKSDVYSFGVMLLEIVCCRKNMDETLRDEEVVLIDWAYHCYEAGEVQNLVIEEDHVDMEELEKMVKIGLWCVETEFSLRPTMKQAILMMEGFVATPPPASPYSSFIRG
ncbi:hypothetical protein AB3S75_002785 [Citrus x aurantiifolia]